GEARAGEGSVTGVARAYIALGSNLGDREATIRDAVAELDCEPGIAVVAVSRLVDTEPVGVVDQPRFLNGVAAVDTELAAADLLAVLLEVERRFGRRREGAVLQGPRTLDLDLILYGDAVIHEPGLVVPHPRLHEREFVLGPLAEIAPGLEVPGKGKVETLRARLH
ncbi:MAG TPA: 2-amino-4-hydroxy-6-hydroxymethyldihydropteridine diphosphokinase, partial [Gaiellaceae bacterium]|nr:2-amino-4-hydroxy-6-hydroxymethyldihydropteridine diphosphokinase [Gaiellaceae bacterium]